MGGWGRAREREYSCYRVNVFINELSLGGEGRGGEGRGGEGREGKGREGKKVC